MPLINDGTARHSERAIEAKSNCVVEITGTAFSLGQNVVNLDPYAFKPPAYTAASGGLYEGLFSNVRWKTHFPAPAYSQSKRTSLYPIPN